MTSKLGNKHWLPIYTAAGNTIPKCVNSGCENKTAIRHWSSQGIPSLHTRCSTCKTAESKGKLLEGVMFKKKTFCENKDGRLGWVCPIDETRYAEFPSSIYHLDHINGNHHDNEDSNLMTLCAVCHTTKGARSGDFNGSKPSSRKSK